MKFKGNSWDPGVYAGLRKFHQLKGFDPESEDVARHLGYPIYQLSREIDTPFAHGELSSLPAGSSFSVENEQLAMRTLVMEMSKIEARRVYLDQPTQLMVREFNFLGPPFH
jgi:sRNA-binding protein